MAVVAERPFPPGDYGVVVVGSGPGGLQTSYSLRALGVRARGAQRGRGAGRDVPPLPRLRAADHLDEAGRAVRARHARVRVVRPQQPARRRSPSTAHSYPSSWTGRPACPPVPRWRRASGAFAERTGLEIRYGCRWEGTRREDDGLVLVTSDGEYRCRAAVFAVGVTEPWKAPIPGVEEALHYAETGEPSRYEDSASSSSASATRASRSRAVCCPGRPSSSWPRRARSSTRSSGARWFARRYLEPLDEYSRGGAGAFVVDVAIERIERTGERLPDPDARHDLAGGARVRGRAGARRDRLQDPAARPARARARDGRGRADSGADAVLGERLRAGRVLRRERVARIARTPQAGPREQLDLGERLSLQRRRPRSASRRDPLRRAAERRELDRNEVVPYLLAELARAPELWVQKGYLARVLSVRRRDP